MEIAKIWMVRTPKPLNRLTKKNWRGRLRRQRLPACQNSIQTPLNREKIAKIGPADREIICLREIKKK